MFSQEGSVHSSDKPAASKQWTAKGAASEKKTKRSHRRDDPTSALCALFFFFFLLLFLPAGGQNLVGLQLAFGCQFRTRFLVLVFLLLDDHLSELFRVAVGHGALLDHAGMSTGFADEHLHLTDGSLFLGQLAFHANVDLGVLL